MTLKGGTDGSDTISVTAGDTNAQWLTGGTGDDTITGGTKNDLIVGNGGHDYLQGAAGSDVLLGGDGNDLLDGGANGTFLDGVDALGNGAGGTARATCWSAAPVSMSQATCRRRPGSRPRWRRRRSTRAMRSAMPMPRSKGCPAPASPIRCAATTRITSCAAMGARTRSPEGSAATPMCSAGPTVSTSSSTNICRSRRWSSPPAACSPIPTPNASIWCSAPAACSSSST